MLAGILKSSSNSGSNAELLAVFAAPLTVRSNQPAYVQDMLNLKRKASSQGAQRWEIETNVVPSSNSAAFMVHSIVNSHVEFLYVRMPQVYGLAQTANGTTLTNDVAVNATRINITGPLTMIPGEFINIGASTKVYMVTEAGYGGQDIGIHPPLLEAAFAADAVKTGTLVTMVARYDTDTKIGISYIDGILSDPGSIKLIEAL